MRSVGCGTRGVGYVTRIVGFLVAVAGLNRIRTRTMFGILEVQDVGLPEEGGGLDDRRMVEVGVQRPDRRRPLLGPGVEGTR
ncbi:MULTISPECIES: hypothetical protein [Streptomyces]|uniref:hypothetical protein n=1 Tax=Streptomyces TaxID=1883 RepID=UPI000AC4C4C9|nr:MULTISPECIES: hypothetical protein [Streptomyces]GHG27077.1 hypothetical protein GCM10018777_47780 [Streptomyces viridodiastaticus]